MNEKVCLIWVLLHYFIAKDDSSQGKRKHTLRSNSKIDSAEFGQVQAPENDSEHSKFVEFLFGEAGLNKRISYNVRSFAQSFPLFLDQE